MQERALAVRENLPKLLKNNPLSDRIQPEEPSRGDGDGVRVRTRGTGLPERLVVTAERLRERRGAAEEVRNDARTGIEPNGSFG